jgi:hypothetical protein
VLPTQPGLRANATRWYHGRHALGRPFSATKRAIVGAIDAIPVWLLFAPLLLVPVAYYAGTSYAASRFAEGVPPAADTRRGLAGVEAIRSPSPPPARKRQVATDFWEYVAESKP